MLDGDIVEIKLGKSRNCNKEIRREHNLERMLLAGSFGMAQTVNEQAVKQKSKAKLYKETLKFVEDIYEKYPAGGALHIVLDDGNVEEHHIKWCIENSIAKLPEDKELFLKCANNLLLMTKTQRNKLLNGCY